MEMIKIKLKPPQAVALGIYIGNCAEVCNQSDQLEGFIKLAYWIVNDLKEQIHKKICKTQQTYTINFKPQEVYVFLALRGKSYDPFEENVIRQIRGDLDKARN